HGTPSSMSWDCSHRVTDSRALGRRKFWTVPVAPPNLSTCTPSFWSMVTYRFAIRVPMGQHVLRAHIPGIDDRARARDRDRFLDPADSHHGVGHGGKACGELDSLPAYGREPGKAEGDRIRTWPQLDDAVPALCVGDGRTHFLDEGRAGRLDRHAGQHRTRRVLHVAGNHASTG